MEELLVRRLETLVDADVSREEVLRQLKQVKPDLKKGEVLANAKRLVGIYNAPADRRRAHEYLKDIMPLEESYITSSGNLGTTRDEVTIWDNPKKPMRFVALASWLFSLVIGASAYMLGAPSGLLFVGFNIVTVVAFIVSMQRAVMNNKWKARQELDENILRRAAFFETTLDKISFT